MPNKDVLRSLKLTLNHLPYPELSPNARLHWRVKGQAARTAREEAGWLAKAEWHDDKPMVRARISYDFTIPNYRMRDLDNLLAAAKPWQDGLIDAGVLTYDDSDHLEIGQVKVVRGTEEQTVIGVQEI